MMEWVENDIRIFCLSVEDAQWLSSTAQKAYFDSYRHLWFDEGEWYGERCFNVEQLRIELSDKNALFFGVEQKKEGLGFLKINLDYPLSKMACQSEFLKLLSFNTDEIPNALELERIYLTKNGQKKGIGRRLVQLVYDQARTFGKDIVWLKAMDTNADAIGFYEKMNFKICATMRLNFEQMKPEMCGMVAMVTPV